MCVGVYEGVCEDVCARVCVSVCVKTSLHAHIHTHTHTPPYTQMWLLLILRSMHNTHSKALPHELGVGEEGGGGGGKACIIAHIRSGQRVMHVVWGRG